MKYSVSFKDLRGREHTVYTDDLYTAEVVAGQLSIQFDLAKLNTGTMSVVYNQGGVANAQHPA